MTSSEPGGSVGPANTEQVDVAPSLDAELARRNLRAARVGCALVAILMPLGSGLDWAVFPEHARTFLAFRLTAGALSGIGYWLTSRPGAERQTLWLMLCPIVAHAGALQAMVYVLRAYPFDLFAGFIQLILGIGVLVSWPLRTAAAVLGGVSVAWFLPMLAVLPKEETAALGGNLFAVGVCAVVAIASSVTRHNAAVREWEAKHRLALASRSLAESLSQVRELSRHKDKFFANISHELRTPLTLIIAPADALAARVPPERKNDVLSIRKNAERLLRLIDELLDLSKLDAGGLRLNIAPLDLPGLVQTLVDTFEPGARAQGIAVRTGRLTDAPDMHGDGHRIEIILTNLIGNAVKYTPAGGSVSVDLTRTESGVRIDVRDTGPGIAPEHLAHVFDRFYQVGTDDRRKKPGGVGIGLALAKELAELHGGSLTVASVVGEGTTFSMFLRRGAAHFAPEAVERRKELVAHGAAAARRPDDVPVVTLPADANPKGAVPQADAGTASAPIVSTPPAAPAAVEGRVLVVDDHDEIRAFVVDVLRDHFEILEATNGADALELIEKQRPDLVVSDIMMPVMNGIELCRRIKLNPAYGQLPVILLTARTGSEATLEAYAHGADDFIAKPFHPGVLLARVRAQLLIRQLSRQLVQQEKLYAVGSLAAGVAHEVRNPVNAILNAGKTLGEVELDAPTQQKLLKVIVDGARRIDGIVGALDAHARPSDQPGKLGISNPKEGIESTVALLGHKTKHVEIDLVFESTRSVSAPPGPVNQVYLNLIDNAVRSGATKLRISTKDDGNDVVSAIADNGPGVPAEIASRIFDPFFTTRAPGEGTGLGLHLAQKIAREHGGELSLHRSPLGGAEFRIRLPAAQAAGA